MTAARVQHAVDAGLVTWHQVWDALDALGIPGHVQLDWMQGRGEIAELLVESVRGLARRSESSRFQRNSCRHEVTRNAKLRVDRPVESLQTLRAQEQMGA